MPRTLWLSGLLLVALFGWIVAWISDWGLITLEANQMPLVKVVHQFEKQGGIHLRCNIDMSTPITLSLHRATVAQAMEDLSIVTEASWSVVYILAPDKLQLAVGREVLGSDKIPAEWRWIRPPSLNPLFAGSTETVFDPRTEHWKLPDEATKELKEWLDGAGAHYEASFLVPMPWNPSVHLKSGGEMTPSRFAERLVDPLRGHVLEVFALTRADRGDFLQYRPEARVWEDSALMDRVEQRLARLPQAERLAVRADIQEEMDFRKELRGLSPEERRKRIEARRNDPAFADKMEDRQARRDEKRTPSQRLRNYQRYVQTKAAVAPHQ